MLFAGKNMRLGSSRFLAWVAMAVAIMIHHSAIADADLNEALADYFLFADPGGSSITFQQIAKGDQGAFLFVDTRTQEEFDKAHIPGAIFMPWQQVFERRDELPRDKQIVLYCNSGASSAQAMMGLKLQGFDNVRTLSGGFRRYQSELKE